MQGRANLSQMLRCSDATLEQNVLEREEGKSCQMHRVTRYESISTPGNNKPSLISAPLRPGYLLIPKPSLRYLSPFSQLPKKACFRVHTLVHCRPCTPCFLKPPFAVCMLEPQTGMKLNYFKRVSCTCAIYSIFTYATVHSLPGRESRKIEEPIAHLTDNLYAIHPSVSMFTCHGSVEVRQEGMQPLRSHAHPSRTNALSSMIN